MPEASLTGEGGGADSLPALRFDDVSKRFGPVTANAGVSLDVRWGEVHAILGENGAGKSTLMRVAAGLHEPDSGHLEVRGKTVRFRRPEQSLEAGIGMVHQHFVLVPTLTAAENIALRPARFPGRSDLAEVKRSAAEVAESMGLQIDLDRIVSDSTISERQRVEIVKLVHRGADIFIFDEPSAALTAAEWQMLGQLMRRLVAEGKAVVLISHKLDELFDVADRFTVLRDGAVTGSGKISEVTRDELVMMMVGREVKLRPEHPTRERGGSVLSVRGLQVAARSGSMKSKLAVDRVSFDVHAGEIVGLAGVAGNGQSELVEAIVGVRASSGGEIELGGRPLGGGGPDSFFRHGGALIPEDRHDAAIAAELSIWANLLMRDVGGRPYSKRGILRLAECRRRTRELIEEYGIRAESEDAPLWSLSGGNQQKVVIARELSKAPSLVIAAQPTRGLDVSASETVYERLNACKMNGGGVLLVSMDLDEVLGLSDRVVVLSGGVVEGILDAAEATPERVGALMTGGAAPV
jgi:general nucleoside transport system ATP-binding protein